MTLSNITHQVSEHRIYLEKYTSWECFVNVDNIHKTLPKSRGITSEIISVNPLFTPRVPRLTKQKKTDRDWNSSVYIKSVKNYDVRIHVVLLLLWIHFFLWESNLHCRGFLISWFFQIAACTPIRHFSNNCP